MVYALLDGPGIVVLERAFETRIVDRVTDCFARLISHEKAIGMSRGDHFAKPGANERLWDAFSKLALESPEDFVDYYANDMIALVAQAWLGPGYQLTSQVNVVNPGGAAQDIHRDYHLGFMTTDQASRYPAQVHRLSPLLTLQGAVAHCDMPVESGPTMYVPHSQKYLPGYLAWPLERFRDYCAHHHVQLPLAKGDAVFFNPALFHAAGHNRSAGTRRMANLLQISSPFGRAMENVDRDTLTRAAFPVLLERKRAGADEEWLGNVVAACAEGYPFPTNLDLDVPLDGRAPGTPAETLWRALREEWAPQVLEEEIIAAAGRRRG